VDDRGRLIEVAGPRPLRAGLRKLRRASRALVVRGLPSLLIYRHDLGPRQRLEMTFITATSLPLLIALADIGEQVGVMLPSTAAALVGAGVLSVLIYPLIAVGLHRSDDDAPVQPDTLDEAPAV
jgi:hypothetical protein